MEYMLETNNLSKLYRKVTVLDELSMHVPKGSIYGLVGRNGAGKTTLIRIICGLQEPTSGKYIIDGIQNSDQKISRARRRMGAVVETPSIYLDLSARENIFQQYRILGIPSDNGAGQLLHLVGLDGISEKKVENFSLGMRQRLGIAIALAGNPDFLVLDEPINGLDPQGIIEIRELILKLNREQGITVLISSHILDELSRLATHYGFIDNGKIIKEISADALEKACQKCIRVEASNLPSLARVLDELGADYRISSNSTADIYSKIQVTELAMNAAKEGCAIISMVENDESLESFYLNLMGGEHNA